MKLFCAVILFSVWPLMTFASMKVGVLAPEGTKWADLLKEMSKEIKTKTNSRVEFKIFYGGAQGDEPDVLRKMRNGLMQGGIFTGKTLGEINGDLRVMEIPFTFFDDVKKGRATLEALTPFFNKHLEKSGMINLGFFEIGLVYLVSQKKLQSLKDLDGVKFWAWEGDTLVDAMIKRMKLIAVPLPLPDVLSSLSTRIVEAAYSPPLAIVALQWNSKVKFLLNYPITYSIGAFLVDQKSWKKVAVTDQAIVQKVVKDYFSKVDEANRIENSESLTILKNQNKVEFTTFSKEEFDKAREVRKGVINDLEGKLFSKEALQLLEKNTKI